MKELQSVMDRETMQRLGVEEVEAMIDSVVVFYVNLAVFGEKS